MPTQAPDYHGYRFPSEVISHAVWSYHRFCLSFRDVEDLLAQRGLTVSYETIRQWCCTFGPEYARTLRRRRGRLGDTWYLDEVFVKIQGRRRYLWRAIDQDGDLIDILVKSRRDRRAAARFFRELLRDQGRVPRRRHTNQPGNASGRCGDLSQSPATTLRVGARCGAESLPSGPPPAPIGPSPFAANAGVCRMGDGDLCLLTEGGGQTRPGRKALLRSS